MSKSRDIKKELVQAEQRKLEIEILLKEAQDEEMVVIDQMKEHINALCSENDLFIGVVLTHDDLLAILKMALVTQESIKIPFNIYLDN